MKQLEMTLRNTDDYLLKHGYYLGPDHNRIMTPRMEHRFGRLMEKAAVGMKGARVQSDTPPPRLCSAVALDAVREVVQEHGHVTAKTLSKAMNINHRSAANILKNLYPMVLKRNASMMTYVYTLTAYGINLEIE